MGEKTGITWTHHTFNAWVGCQHVSRGCDHCYAEVSTLTRIERGKGTELWGPPAQTTRKILSPEYWQSLRKWNAKAKKAGEVRRVFMSSLSDFWERHPAVEDARCWVLDMIGECDSLIFQILTKRPENIVPILRDIAAKWPKRTCGIVATEWLNGDPPPNVWLGVTAEDQVAFDRRWPILSYMPAKVRFVSYEPALGPLEVIESCHGGAPDWIIVGGESGVGARPFDVGWARAVIDACYGTVTHVFVKQLGAHTIGLLDHESTALSGKAGEMEEWPDDLRVRAFP